MHVRGALSLDFSAESYTHPTGTVDAGTVIAWIDKVGYAVAASWSGSFVRAAYVGNMQFRHPVPVDTRATVQARVVYTEGAQIHVQTRLLLPEIPDAEGRPVVCTDCLMVYTAEEDGVPQDVPVWEPATERQAERARQAREATGLRAEIEGGMAAMPFPDQVGERDELVTLRFLAGASHATVGSTVRAAAVMRWIDEAAAVCAARWSGTENVVAAFAGGVRFVETIRVGEVVSVDALLVHTSARAMHVALRVYAARRHERRGRVVAHSLAVMVAPDDGRARPVEQWEPESEWAAGLEEKAVELVRLRSEAGATWSSV
ncbi:acyl-CoA thioesterase [uncultured Micrococcus sp.]|uniref:acyl-CoA thioesterase n=1 Tax=uncultured Micrococcus sp. TaxID=114051 RepID=UPI002598159E|nr:hotdog domain-containing protein [uncultured Micrococcus sp.]